MSARWRASQWVSFRRSWFQLTARWLARSRRPKEIQAALPGDAALVVWVDIPPLGPGARRPRRRALGRSRQSQRRCQPGFRSKGPVPTGFGPKTIPFWRARRADRAAETARIRAVLPRLLVERLRAHALDPLTKALGMEPAVSRRCIRLIVLPTRAMAGIPSKRLLALRRYSDSDLCSVGHRVQVLAHDQPRAPAPAAQPCWPRRPALRSL